MFWIRLRISQWDLLVSGSECSDNETPLWRVKETTEKCHVEYREFSAVLRHTSSHVQRASSLNWYWLPRYLNCWRAKKNTRSSKGDSIVILNELSDQNINRAWPHLTGWQRKCLKVRWFIGLGSFTAAVHFACWYLTGSSRIQESQPLSRHYLLAVIFSNLQFRFVYSKYIKGTALHPICTLFTKWH